MMKVFLLATLGTTVHLNVYYAGLAYTSATVASALSNVIPSLTFVMAVLFRYILHPFLTSALIYLSTILLPVFDFLVTVV